MASFITPLFKVANIFHGLKGLAFERQKTQIGDLIIDASLKEDINVSSNITEHAVETGQSISDHISQKPLKLKIDGYISNAPNVIFGILNLPLQKNSISSLVNNFKNLSPFSDGETPSQTAYNALMQLWKDRALITIVTQLQVFNNMVIENATFTKDETSVHRLVFSIEFKQVTFVSSEKSLVSRTVNKALSAINSKVSDLGITEKRKSIAKTILGKFNG